MRYEQTGDGEIESRINNYELAFRMQMEAPDLMDFSDEKPETLEMYGLDSENEHRKQYATNCLLARRLVERGVRFVLMMDASWDDHTYLNDKIPKRMDEVDKPTAALIKDLKRLGLLDETLVVWGGEFRAHPDGRDPQAGGGRQRGPRPPSARLLDVDGRRRHQGRPNLRRDRRAVPKRHQGPRPRA